MSYVMHPWLLVAGICAVSLPVLIHLLNRRRFRVVDWAAMDFLLEADKQSRRRIRLQHWLLLLLRSLAVALIGLLLARPFVPNGMARAFAPGAPTERIIVLDDSLSMQARVGNESAWEAAKRGTIGLLRRLAAQNGGKDTFTLLVTSHPDQPLVRGGAMSLDRLDELQSRLDQVKCSDVAGNLAATFRALTDSLRSPGSISNRVVYVFTDLRRVDWQANSGGADETSESVQQLSEQLHGCYLIDTGSQRDENLTIASVETDGPIVSGVRSVLNVTVLNQGSTSANRVAVKLFIDDGPPAVEQIERFAPGAAEIVHFNLTLTCEGQSSAEEKRLRPLQPRRVRVELNAENSGTDLLSADSSFYFPAQVRCGIRTLLVDGDPSPEFGKAESFYLQRALAPSGPVPSGVLPQVVNGNDFDSLPLADDDVIFLLNCAALGVKSDENVARLSQWVAKGGRLVLMPGDQTDAGEFNRLLWQDGKGLSPLRLENIVGDPAEQTWSELRFADGNTLVPQLTAEQQTLLQNVKFFRRWRLAGAKNNPNQAAEVVATFSDSDHAPAIVQQSWGEGRVVLFAIPADADWDNWPSSPSYVLLVQELVHSLVSNDANRGQLRAGEAIRQPLDLAEYEAEGVLTGPEQSRTRISATTPGSGAGPPQLQMTSPALERVGFYELSLSHRDDGPEQLLFAANAEKKEGDLKRADLPALTRQLAPTNVWIWPVNETTVLSDAGFQTELSRYLAWLLITVLASEQALGWLFGRQRT